VRTVEDDYLALARCALMGSPEEIVGGFVLAGLLEAEYGGPLWIHAAEHMPHYPIFAGGIQCLQYNQQ
jgi:hypothetical protein